MGFNPHFFERNMSELLTESLMDPVPYFITDDSIAPTKLAYTFTINKTDYSVVVYQASTKGIYKVAIGAVPSKNLMLWKVKPGDVRVLLSTVINIMKTSIDILGQRGQAYVIRLPDIVKKNYSKLLERIVNLKFKDVMKCIPVNNPDKGNKYLFVTRKIVDPIKIFKTKDFAEYKFDNDSPKAGQDPVKIVGAKIQQIEPEILDTVKDKIPLKKTVSKNPSDKYIINVQTKELEVTNGNVLSDKLINGNAKINYVEQQNKQLPFTAKEFSDSDDKFIRNELISKYFKNANTSGIAEYEVSYVVDFFAKNWNKIVSAPLHQMTSVDLYGDYDMYKLATQHLIALMVRYAFLTKKTGTFPLEIFKNKKLSQPTPSGTTQFEENLLNPDFLFSLVPNLFLLSYDYTNKDEAKVKELIKDAKSFSQLAQTVAGAVYLSKESVIIDTFFSGKIFNQLNVLDWNKLKKALLLAFERFFIIRSEKIDSFNNNVEKYYKEPMTITQLIGDQPDESAVSQEVASLDIADIDLSSEWYTGLLDEYNPADLVEMKWTIDERERMKLVKKLEPYTLIIEQHEKRGSVKNYTGMAYESYNAFFRQFMNDKSIDPDNFYLRTGAIDILKVFRDMKPLETPIWVFRGTSIPKPPPIHEISDVLVDPGFLSTSLNPMTASTFSQSTLLKIFIPAGSKVLPVLEYSEHKSEYEVILPPMSVLKPVKVTEVTRSNGVIYQVIECVYVGNAKNYILKKIHDIVEKSSYPDIKDYKNYVSDDLFESIPTNPPKSKFETNAFQESSLKKIQDLIKLKKIKIDKIPLPWRKKKS